MLPTTNTTSVAYKLLFQTVYHVEEFQNTITLNLQFLFPWKVLISVLSTKQWLCQSPQGDFSSSLALAFVHLSIAFFYKFTKAMSHMGKVITFSRIEIRFYRTTDFLSARALLLLEELLFVEGANRYAMVCLIISALVLLYML